MNLTRRQLVASVLTTTLSCLTGCEDSGETAAVGPGFLYTDALWDRDEGRIAATIDKSRSLGVRSYVVTWADILPRPYSLSAPRFPRALESEHVIFNVAGWPKTAGYITADRAVRDTLRAIPRDADILLSWEWSRRGSADTLFRYGAQIRSLGFEGRFFVNVIHEGYDELFQYDWAAIGCQLACSWGWCTRADYPASGLLNWDGRIDLPLADLDSAISAASPRDWVWHPAMVNNGWV